MISFFCVHIVVIDFFQILHVYLFSVGELCTIFRLIVGFHLVQIVSILGIEDWERLHRCRK